MACKHCGSATYGSRRECRTCELDRRYGNRGADDSPEQPDSVVVECTVCETVYEHDGANSCPDCDARQRRYVGDLDHDGDAVEC